jgi:hypothetical protein
MVILRCAFSCLNYGTRNFYGDLTMCFFVFELGDSEFLWRSYDVLFRV